MPGALHDLYLHQVLLLVPPLQSNSVVMQSVWLRQLSQTLESTECLVSSLAKAYSSLVPLQDQSQMEKRIEELYCRMGKRLSRIRPALVKILWLCHYSAHCRLQLPGFQTVKANYVVVWHLY